MARAGKMTVLKVAAIARAKAPGYYSDGGGLFRYGTASWVFRYRVAGRLSEMGLVFEIAYFRICPKTDIAR